MDGGRDRWRKGERDGPAHEKHNRIIYICRLKEAFTREKERKRKKNRTEGKKAEKNKSRTEEE